jgi:hypothetical protein
MSVLVSPTALACPADHAGVPLRLVIPLNPVQLAAGKYTVVVNGVSTTFDWQPGARPPAPTHHLEFERGLQAALAERNANRLEALMDDPFLMAYWRSEGISVPAAEAASQIFANFLYGDGGPAFQPVPESLGFDPYSMLGSEAELAKAIFSTSWGPTGQGEAMLVVARRPNGELYWHSMLIALEGF